MWTKHVRTNIAEMRPWTLEDRSSGAISISQEDAIAGSPKVGDWVARNPENHKDQWLVSAAYYDKNFEPLGDPTIDPEESEA